MFQLKYIPSTNAGPNPSSPQTSDSYGNLFLYSFLIIAFIFHVIVILIYFFKFIEKKVAGYAVGGGHVLHMVCDLTIAADNAVFGQTGPKVISHTHMAYLINQGTFS